MEEKINKELVIKNIEEIKKHFEEINSIFEQGNTRERVLVGMFVGIKVKELMVKMNELTDELLEERIAKEEENYA